MTKKENRISFLTNAINDAQNIIRAVDVKIQVLLAFLLIPFALLKDIFDSINSLAIAYPSGSYHIYMIIIVILFWITWIFSLLIALSGLASIGNPNKHVRNDIGAKGTFYLGFIFRPKIWHSLTRTGLKSTLSLSAIIDNLPKTDDEHVKELAFEHMKVVFIRDLKMFRQKLSLSFMLFWLFTGALIILLQHSMF